MYKCPLSVRKEQRYIYEFDKKALLWYYDDDNTPPMVSFLGFFKTPWVITFLLHIRIYPQYYYRWNDNYMRRWWTFSHPEAGISRAIIFTISDANARVHHPCINPVMSVGGHILFVCYFLVTSYVLCAEIICKQIDKVVTQLFIIEKHRILYWEENISWITGIGTFSSANIYFYYSTS